MANKDEVELNDPIVLYHKNFGFVRAWAKEDHRFLFGASSLFKVTVNSESFSAISDMTINTNDWDVYKETDPTLIKLLLDEFVKHEYSR